MISFLGKTIALISTLLTHTYIVSMSMYDQASLLAQQGKWDKADEAVQMVVVNRYESPSVLYDAGVTSFQTKKYKEAATYFEQVISHGKTKPDLKEQALFNAGNSYVALKELPKAITCYEAILRQNPDHKRAKHNLDIVKKMLEQQEQEKQNQEKDKNKKQQKQQPQKDNQEQQQKQDQQQNSSQQSQEKGDQQEQQSSGSDNQSRDPQQEEQKADDTNKNQQRDKQQQLDKEPSEKQEQKQQQNGSDHTKTPEQKKPQQQPSSSQDTQEEKSSQATTPMPQQKTPEEQWLAHMLEERDKADEQASKQLMKAIMTTHTAGRHGYSGKKCW